MELPLPKARVQPTEWYSLEFDGGSRGNPGPAGYGSVLRCCATGQLVQVVAGIIPYNTTNNQAEYSAVLAGLKAASALGVRYVSVQGDSELIVRQLTGIYKASEKGGLAQRLAEAKRLLAAFQEHSVKHVYREENKDADLLGNLAMDVLRLVPSRPNPTSRATEGAQIDAQVQQLLQTASRIPQHLSAPSPAADSSQATGAAGLQAGQPEHVGVQLRAVVLRRLLQQWLTSAATFEQVDAGDGAARREISRPVVIDLALPCEVLKPPPVGRGRGSGRGDKGKSSGKRSRSRSKEKGAQ
uniref:RNase H type-1 domain-containing protein n=2 Tax=Dunaliella tertiolecta TaxID=3047 RepID=A0A7S3QW73_DUNTE|mmetsp:Transcript_7864/g.20982  ORF Transcript_7864/g.20982 Transcript_7864/m.20982 type:complete len:298 (+) Transcript_7864:332-1225(+)